ncbi:MAG TPA: cysteine desulfurase-like protein [Gemmataceae bacterium]|jgi:cysteine desulfurase family protein (TIGR01976 family)
MMFDVNSLREQFPSLNRTRVPAARPAIFLDGPGGTQVPQCVVEAMVHYLTTCNANHGGVFATSRESDAILHEAHQAAADLLNAPSAEEIIFGPNMTTLTFHLSRAFGRTLRPGDEMLVTRLDHDANVRPWVLAARDAGATVHFVDIHPEDCTLDLDHLRRLLSPRVRLVAVTCASNAVGTVTDVRLITRLAHEAGALVFLDAVHYAPHRLIDVQDWDCDFLACSAYKFFGPHVGILWGKQEHLHGLPAYKLRPATDDLPGRWMTGTQNHEGLAGTAAAIDYLASIDPSAERTSSRRQRLERAFHRIEDYERTLAECLLDGLRSRPRFRVLGITQRERLSERVPTVSITTAEHTPQQIAEHLAKREIYAWNGNMYALELTECLGLEEHRGLLRLGLVHYNTTEEIDALLQALDEL